MAARAIESDDIAQPAEQTVLDEVPRRCEPQVLSHCLYNGATGHLPPLGGGFDPGHDVADMNESAM